LGTSTSSAVATADIMAAVMMMAMEANIFCNSFDPVQERDVVYPDSAHRAYSCILMIETHVAGASVGISYRSAAPRSSPHNLSK
jgi:hypothetical protein